MISNQKINLNNIKSGYNELYKGNLLEARKYFIESYNILSNGEYIIDTSLLDNYISLCKGLAEVNLKDNKVIEALDNYLFIYNNLSNIDFDTVASLGQIYKNIGDLEKSVYFLEISKKNNPILFKERFGDSIETISSRTENNNIYIYIISKCNFNCCFCDRGQDEYKNNIKMETTLAEVKNLFSQVNIDNLKSISIGGNEPLTNINIFEILKFLNSLNIDLKLYTSGSEKDKIDELLIFNNLKVVYLPIYSNNGDIHDNIVGKKGAFGDLKLIKNILIKNNIKVNFVKLLIKANYKDPGFIKKGEYFSALHPRDKKLYFNNSISLTDIVSKIDFLSYSPIDLIDLIESNTIPICTIYDLMHDKINFINKYKSDFSKIKQLRLSQNIIQEYFKPLKCNKCFLNNYCLGYYKLYFEKYGEDEIRPILDIN